MPADRGNTDHHLSTSGLNMHRTAVAQLRKVIIGQVLTGKPLLVTALTGALALTVSSGTARYQAEASDLTWSVPLSGVATAVNSQVFIGSSGGGIAHCDDVKATVSAKRGTGLSGDGIVSVTDLELKSIGNVDDACRAPYGLGVTISALGLPWDFDARAYDARTGVTTGRVSGIAVNVAVTNGCQITVADGSGGPGEVDATYENSTGRISILDYGHLKVTSTAGSCPGVVVGGEVILSGMFKLAPYGIIRSP
ncbi:hypothetical protein [Actinomadura sp. 6K520]|uniref:hypothetical protein n=1 Tax=Actinomadura sp. 6K520 TaxID=2530364 RepID=UPI001042BDA2|nr:hypothetical protein [Actinomadura sp. 6K520]TDE34054.1 hypothetical protein E1289_10565 [Actinomadura sp. 6K520]